ncbi:MAG: MarR family winged helix-turn-helix transcriptional regulator [Candidatus Merdivicinus sp.]|jgi:DNA-binding MarR family transcriptional regulator
MNELFGKYMSIIHRQKHKFVCRALEHYGLGFSEYLFLLYISKQEGCTQNALCQILMIDAALATRSMRKLEKQNLIERRSIPNDQRAYALWLTSEGRAIIPDLIQALDQWWDTLLGDFSPEQKTLLLSQLEIMAKKAAALTTDLSHSNSKTEESE